MTTKKVNLVISLKDGVSAGLNKIGGGLKTIGTGFKNLAKIGAAAFAAIAAGVVVLGKAFAEQETANKRLKSAFDAVGESGKDAVKIWGAWATEIQRTTTLGDEEIMNLITLGKVMGVTNDKLAEATKGAIGLSKAFGIDMTAAMKMVALAQQGEFEMLARYIPALRAATTESEKQTIVNEAMANGFKMAEAELGTMAGQWESLKGVIGDAMQEAGKAVGEGGFIGLITDLKEALIELSESGAIASWAKKASSGFQSVISQAKQAADTIRKLRMRSEVKSEVEEAVFGKREDQGVLEFRRKQTPENREKVEEFTNRIMKKRLADERMQREKMAMDEAAKRKDDIAKEADLEKQRKFQTAKAAADKNKELGKEVAKEVAETQVEELKTKMEEAAPELGEAVGGAIAQTAASGGGGATGTTGFAELSAQMSGSGMSRFDVRSNNRRIARAEATGREAGVSGFGQIAGGLASQGLTGIDLDRAIGDALRAELSGRKSSEVNVGEEAVKTNELLTAQNAILAERLGGVKE